MLRTYTRILPVLAVAGAAGLLLVGPAWAAEVWVTNMKSANVQVIDPETMQVVATIPVDKGAHNVTLSPDDAPRPQCLKYWIFLRLDSAKLSRPVPLPPRFSATTTR